MTNDINSFVDRSEDPQIYGLSASLSFVWDVATLSWVKGTQAVGGVSVAVTVADGADVAEGSVADAAVITDASGTVSGKLRGLVKWAFERMPTSLGQKTMAASLPVVIASDQTSISVSTNGLTDAQLRATPVPVSGAVTNTVLSVVGGGAEATAQRVTIANDSTGLLSVDDNGASLTVDAPVGTPVFVSLSDGAAPITTLPISAVSLPLPATASTAALQTQPGVDIGDVTVNNAAGASAVNIQDGGNSITVDGTVVSTAAIATVADPTYTEAAAAALSVDLNGRLRSVVYGLIEGLAEVYTPGQIKPISLTQQGRMMVSARIEPLEDAVVIADSHDDLWATLRPWDNEGKSFYDGSPWNAW